MRRLLSLALLPFAFAACSSSGDGGTVTPPVTPSIGLALSSAASTVARSSSGSVGVTLNRLGSYTGLVTLRAENLPAGVTAAFTSPTLVGSGSATTLTFDVAASAVAGTTAITLRASGTGVADATTTFTLTISAPAITLVAGSSAASAAQGASATVPLTITRVGGFAAAVDLTAENLPAGVTASFAPVSLAAGVTTSTLTLTAAANATAGTSSVTVRASGSGVTSQTATVAFTITSSAIPDFALTASPASITLTGGASGTSAIAIARSGGFTGNVTLALEGAPAGVTGTFAPNATNANASVLTIATTSATVAGTYNLVVRGTATGQADRTTAVSLTVSPVPAITVAVGSPTLSAAAGATAQSTVTVVRVGAFAGDVALTLENAPPGVTGAFTPSTLTSGLTASTLALTVGANTAPGAYTLTVRASGTGVTSQTATIALTVTATAPPQNFSLSATTASALQGATATSTVTITRTGNFAGSVALSVSGLPAGVTATFNPTSTTGNTSTLSLQVGSAVGPGTYTGTITGTAAGLTNVTANVSLTVTPSGGGGGNVAFRFCAQTSIPTFFAFRSGTTGAWTAVTPSNNTYSFTLSQTVGQVAYGVANSSGGVNMTVLNYAASEFPSVANSQCVTAPATKTLTGVVAGLAAGQSATISVGTGSTTVSANGAFTITSATDGTTDLIATRVSLNLQTFSQSVDKVILRRNINTSAGTTVGAVVDFGASEAVAPATASVTVNNVNGETLTGLTTFQSANGASGSFINFSATLSSPLAMTGVPSSLTQAGDFHITTAIASQVISSTNINSRSVLQYNRDLASRTVTLGAAANAPTYSTIAASPYARIRVQGSWQADYPDFMAVSFTQGNLRNWSIITSRAFAGAGSATFDADVPDLSGVGSFNNNWGLVAGSQTQYTFNVYSGFAGFSTFTEGTAFRIGTRSTTQAP